MDSVKKTNITETSEVPNLVEEQIVKIKKNYKAKFCEICKKDYKDFYQHRKIKHSDKLNKTINLSNEINVENQLDPVACGSSSSSPAAPPLFPESFELLMKIDMAIDNLNEVAALIRLKLNSL